MPLSSENGSNGKIATTWPWKYVPIVLITPIIMNPMSRLLFSPSNVICWLILLSCASVCDIFFSWALDCAWMTWVVFSFYSFLFSFSISPAWLDIDYLCCTCRTTSCRAAANLQAHWGKSSKRPLPKSTVFWVYRSGTRMWQERLAPRWLLLTFRCLVNLIIINNLIDLITNTAALISAIIYLIGCELIFSKFIIY